MSGAFDPYYRWLGIRPKDQPAHHYRLLGIDLFEDDSEVIRDAAEQRMAHVRTYQLGEYAELSQHILNELAAAKACLLDKPRKSAYDGVLRAKQKPKVEAPPVSDDVYGILPPDNDNSPPATRTPTGRPNVGTPNRLGNAFTKALANKAAPKESRTIPWNLWVAGAGSLCIFGIVVILILNSTGALNGFHCSSGSSDSTSLDTLEAGSTGNSTSTNSAKERPPRLDAIPKQVVREGETLRFLIRLADRGTYFDQVLFRLDGVAPNGASLNPKTGEFIWKPEANQSPKAGAIMVRVYVDGHENLSDWAMLHLTYQPAEKPPAIRDFTPPKVVIEEKTTLPIVATPVNSTGKLTYRLEESPDWATIDAATGVLVFEPSAEVAPDNHPVTVCVQYGDSEALTSRKTFSVTVEPKAVPVNPPVGRPILGKTAYELHFPSGTTLASAKMDIRDAVRRDIDLLMQKCRSFSPDAIGIFQEGSSKAIAALVNTKGTKPHGAAVYFYSGGGNGLQHPKRYIVYQSGKWDGIVAAWDENGNREFWGNYSHGQRDGLCCMFDGDALSVVFECDQNKIQSVHVINGGEIVKSFINEDEALADANVKPMLERFDQFEQDIKAEDRQFCDRVKQGVQLRIGAVNTQKREAMSARSAARSAEQEQTIRGLRRLSGW